ncbi:methyltransferase domain-containing protein [Dokdonia sp. Hel_I_53]|uniref:methyltransferase domain-containing protein n=1 Tax=Dokdonia sp. Hel_I_53 TaxID=1566287 RepID=UPI00119C6124|nr:methyltransferase domain-containing protein [Dokdonia sp. Hel_I_53]TVZ51696.1 methyltransferase family protein [Dokdonia sp. Hel_I_53]
MNFSKRSTLPELMDNPELPEPELQLALQDLALVNKYLGGNGITIKALERIVSEHPDKNKWHIIDVGCGDGEMLRQVAQHFAKKSLDIKFLGIDINEKSIAAAKKQSEDLQNISFEQKDIHTLEADDLKCDIVLFTLTMHHLTDSQILLFLETCKKIASVAIIVNDLQRSKLAYRLFQVFSGIFMKSKIAIYDGKISVARSFKRKDLEEYSKKLALDDYLIKWKWAFRYLWIINI